MTALTDKGLIETFVQNGETYYKVTDKAEEMIKELEKEYGVKWRCEK